MIGKERLGSGKQRMERHLRWKALLFGGEQLNCTQECNNTGDLYAVVSATHVTLNESDTSESIT